MRRHIYIWKKTNKIVLFCESKGKKASGGWALSQEGWKDIKKARKRAPFNCKGIIIDSC